MYELYHLWLWSRSNSELFHERVRIYNIDAEISKIADRLKIASEWADKFDEYTELAQKRFRSMGEATFRTMKKVQQFYVHTNDILSHIADRVQPKDFDAFIEHGFSDL